jgi:hypothetical protein
MLRFTTNDNLFGRGAYGLYGDTWGEGTVALDRYASGWMFAGNVVHGTTSGAPKATAYPAGSPVANVYPATAAGAGISPTTTALGRVGVLTTVFPLDASLTALRGTDGAAPGANLAVLRTLLTGVVTR